MFKKILVVGCLLFVVSYHCFAQGIADYSLQRGFSVRAAGMGGAYAAIADDGAAVFYNPACLASPGFTYTYGNPDSDQKSIDGSFQFAKLGYIGYGHWNMMDTSNNDEISATAVGFGNRSGWLNWGMTHKSLSWTLSGATQEGWTADFGFLCRVTPQLSLGFVGYNVLTGQTNPIGGSGRLGFGYKPLKDRLTIAGDVEIHNLSLSTDHIFETRYGHLGVEATVVDGFTVRGGIDRGEYAVGMTLDLAVFSFDYAALFEQSGSTVHRFETGIKILPLRERPFSIIKPKEYALIDVSGVLQGGRTEYSFLGGVKPGVDSVLSQIRRAAKDSAIDGIMLKVSGFSAGLSGMAMVQEIRSELLRARKKGKKIVAYVEGSAMGDEYYLAAVADKIIAPPGTMVGGFGQSISLVRLKGLFDKLGIEWQVFSQGKYKDAFDSYGRAKLTKEQKEMTQSLVAELYRQMITDIASDRKLAIEEVKEIGDGLFFTAQQAKELGLIDEVGYYKDARLIAAAVAGEEDKKKEAKMVESRFVEPEEVFLSQVFGVAVIEIDGEIVSGNGGENVIFGGRWVGSETVAKYIRKASDDMFVKAIILRINSPGGSAIASGEIYKALQYAKDKEKVLVASIGSMGTSGGYYIAAAADKIVADKSSLTGSIGVIGYMPSVAGLFKKLDIESEVIKEGKHADMFSGFRKLSPEELAAISALQEESYEEFIQAVAEGRGLSTQQVEEAAQGRLYTGSQALELKLIDQLGGFSDAIDLAKAEAKIGGEPRLIFYHEPSLFFQFGGGITESLGFRDWLFWKSLSDLAEYN
ncbi:signal peptide peptidase SppA [Candidatus Margulisiibacteriota bacterium]